MERCNIPIRMKVEAMAKIIHPPVKEAPTELCDSSKARDFVEVIDRAPFLPLIIDHFSDFSRRVDMPDGSGLTNRNW
jgi:hypothetical protein